MRVVTCVAALCVAQGAALLRPPPAVRTCHPRLALSVPASPAPAVSSPTNEAAPMLSGLQGQALRVEADDVPSRNEAQSLLCTAACVAVGLRIPLSAAFLPLWLCYAGVTGTVAMGLWVLAHECGHGAFSDNRLLQDAVGYVLHSALLVPYFSWQRSHAMHHAHTNHIYKGETHVPSVIDGREGHETPGGANELALAARMGATVHGAYQLFGHLTIGWPTYLLFGLTSGPKWTEAGGMSNHFWPFRPCSAVMWPGKWASKVLGSTAGVAAALGVLGWWATKAGAGAVMALYGGPLLVINMWLITYTWLQHTDVDVPHLSAEAFSYMRGAFLTIDRPYPPLIDWLHHRIGTTHVAHHIDCTIPHYHAQEATGAIKRAFPKAYLFDPTPVPAALWRIARHTPAVSRREDGRYVFVQP